MQRESGLFAHEGLKQLARNDRNFARLGSKRGRAAWTIVNERNFANDAARSHMLQHFTVSEHVETARQNGIHFVACLMLEE